jgi:hypothetical protein
MFSEVNLRAAVEIESDAISKLRDKIQEAPLRLLLETASNSLTVALTVYLDPKAMQRMKTPEEMELWLDQAAQHIERAARIRKDVEAALKL